MKYLILAASVLLLSACASQPERIIVRTPNQQLEIVAPATPRPPNIQDVQVDVYDKERIFEELTNNRFEPIIGMTPQNYETLLNNVAETSRYIQMQQAIIRFYQNVISELQQ